VSDEDGASYALVMPFLPVTSRGGPHDDEAYVAGVEMGFLDRDLVNDIVPADGQPVHATNREQADLIAMHRGYTAEFADVGDGWLHATFTRSGECS
jgi:hypothetical protein